MPWMSCGHYYIHVIYDVIYEMHGACHLRPLVAPRLACVTMLCDCVSFVGERDLAAISAIGVDAFIERACLRYSGLAMEGLPNHKVSGKQLRDYHAAITTLEKQCVFCCGETSRSCDPCDPETPIKWAYPPREGKPQGDADYYCDRTFKCAYSHLHKRNEFVQKIGRDKKLHSEFHAKRAGFVESKKGGNRMAWGVQKKSLVEEEDQEMRLVRPEDEFWPMDRYKRKFGKVSSTKNQKLGHVKTTVHGVDGVIVPGDDGEMPFKLQRSTGSKVKKITIVDDGESIDSEGEIDKKFGEMKEAKQADYESSAKGVIASVLAVVAADRAQEKQDKGDDQSNTESSSESSSTEQANRKKTKKKVEATKGASESHEGRQREVQGETSCRQVHDPFEKFEPGGDRQDFPEDSTRRATADGLGGDRSWFSREDRAGGPAVVVLRRALANTVSLCEPVGCHSLHAGNILQRPGQQGQVREDPQAVASH